MKEEILVPKNLLIDLVELLDKFKYERDEDSLDKSFFEARLNEDWFFHLKFEIERLTK